MPYPSTGTGLGDALSAAESTPATSFNSLRKNYESQWEAYDAGFKAPPNQLSGVGNTQWHALVNEYYLSANLLKAAEDKMFPGALQAGPTSPWGQAVSAGDPNNTYFGSYREVFARDLYEEWTGLFVDGDTQTASDAVHFLSYHQQLPDGSMPRNSLPNGLPAPDSFGTQLDECSYPIIMANQMGMTDALFYTSHVMPAANFVASHGPAFGVERWEEQGGYLAANSCLLLSCPESETPASIAPILSLCYRPLETASR
jgi:glucoamylase